MESQITNIMIRALGAPDAEAYRQLRLTALATSPEAFGSSYEEESQLPFERFRARVAPAGPNVIFGAFAGDHLVGMAGFGVIDQIKKRHWGVLWGVFLLPDWRGRGVGAGLVARVVEHATGHVQFLQACVVTTNHKARQIYLGLGFVPYGIERQALLIDGRFYDEELLALDLRKNPPAVA
jgi:RimJ/RimL family protein N-acetyltransferase